MTQVSRLGSETNLLLETTPRFQPDDLRALAFRFHGLDWNKTIRVWEAFRILFPEEPDGFIFGTLALREAGRLVEAEALSDGVLGVFANHSRLFIERALICVVTADWPEAKRRFAHIRKTFPGELDGYVRGAEVAQNLAQYEEALQLMETTVRRFPDSREVLENYARLAERRGDTGRAAAAWREHRERYGEELAFIGQAQALANAGDAAAAEMVLADGELRHPGSLGIRAEAARMAVRRADWPEAVRRWTSLADDPACAREAASRLKDAAYFLGVPASGVETVGGGLGPSLDALLSKTWTFRFRKGQILGQNVRFGRHGELLNHIGAERRWAIRDGGICLIDADDHVTTVFTTVDLGDDGKLRLSGRDWVHVAENSHYVLEEQRPAIGTVMSAFESLGDNCEFGLVQRLHGIEPPGLLRFSSSGYEHLLAGLTSNFQALDDPDCVRAYRNEQGELIGHVEAYEFYYHTHRFNADIDIAAFQKAEAVRLRYLADILIENIQDGSKIFLRKGEKASELDKVLRLHESMRRLGDCKLLWVTEADEAHPSGTVEIIGDGLMHGYIEKLAPYHAAARAMFDCWTEICVRAHQLVYPAAWGDLRPSS